MENIKAIHYKFRFTFSEQDKTFAYEDQLPRWRTMSRRLVEKLLAQYKIDKMTGGVETINRSGDKTWCHLHLHFTATEARDTIARYIKRYLADTYDQQVVGVKFFMLKPDVARHEDEFFRYCLKQSFDKKLCYGFDEETLQIFHQSAQSSYLKCQEINQKKIDKSDNSDTLFSRLKIKLGQTGFRDKKALLIEATKFYVEEDKPINRVTIQGYVDTYMLQEKLITYEDYWN